MRHLHWAPPAARSAGSPPRALCLLDPGVVLVSSERWLGRTKNLPPPAAQPSPCDPLGPAAVRGHSQSSPPGASTHPNLPGCALRCWRAARVSMRLRSSFSVFPSIKKNVAGGGQPPTRLREPSCGDFHSLPQVLQNRLTLRVQSFSCQFLPTRPQVCLISENPRLPRGSGGFHLEGR